MNGCAEKAEVTTETSRSPSGDQLRSLLKAPYIPTHWFTLMLCSVPQLWFHGLYPSGTSVHGTFSGRNTGVDCLSTSMGSPQPRDQTHTSCISALQEDSLLPSHHESWASLVVQLANSQPTMWENRVRSLGGIDPLEKEMATHSSILAWRIPWTEEPGGLQSMGSQRVGHDWVTNTHPS